MQNPATGSVAASGSSSCPASCVSVNQALSLENTTIDDNGQVERSHGRHVLGVLLNGMLVVILELF
ncbi:hypothetical protein [Variovorax sp. V213]|uniref:hypothetical protein n=1 Tax=Variovorax sp. V213 TaxID=3065955 RepID=UPI0034E88295